jgi:hypothetical protein
VRAWPSAAACAAKQRLHPIRRRRGVHDPGGEQARAQLVARRVAPDRRDARPLVRARGDLPGLADVLHGEPDRDRDRDRRGGEQQPAPPLRIGLERREQRVHRRVAVARGGGQAALQDPAQPPRHAAAARRGRGP